MSYNELEFSSETRETKNSLVEGEANPQLPPAPRPVGTNPGVSLFLAQRSRGADPLAHSPMESLKNGAASALRNFSRLCELCTKIFTEEPVTAEEVALSTRERTLFNALLKRKFGKGVTRAQLRADPAQLVQATLRVCAKKHNKRPEECYKFVLSRVFKTLKARFAEAQQVSGLGDGEAFYKYYFEELCADGSAQLADFFVRSKNAEAKTPIKVSVRYIRLVAHSDQLRRDVEFLFEREFLEQCRREVARKLAKLFRKLEKWIHEGSEEALSWARVAAYITSDRFCKLPWTTLEARHALLRFSSVW